MGGREATTRLDADSGLAPVPPLCVVSVPVVKNRVSLGLSSLPVEKASEIAILSGIPPLVLQKVNSCL